MEQTAVEWLIDWMGKNQYFIGNDLFQAFKQAKEMEIKQIKCYCGHTIYCDCEPLEEPIISEEAKQRAKNYMRLKDGYVEPKDVILGYKTSLDAQMLDRIELQQETLEEAAENAYKKHSVKDDALSLNEQIQRSGGFIVGFKEGMIEGANWQAERMYSEEDILDAWELGAKEGLPLTRKKKEELFKQFKKK